MKSKYNFDCELIKDRNALDDDIKELIIKAEKQLQIAYAPYSKFLVGAAVLLESGEIYPGCNQENASYPLSLCAERVALFNMASHHQEFKIKAIAITASYPTKPLLEVVMPCGACRQVIQEFEMRQNQKVNLYLTSENNEIVKISGIETLLPHSFNKDILL